MKDETPKRSGLDVTWDDLKIGFAMCGSFCSFDKALVELAHLRESGADITPILSENAYSTDTRFGAATDWVRKIEDICKKKIVYTIQGAEPIGPKALLDILVVAPCTGDMSLLQNHLGLTAEYVVMP